MRPAAEPPTTGLAPALSGPKSAASALWQNARGPDLLTATEFLHLTTGGHVRFPPIRRLVTQDIRFRRQSAAVRRIAVFALLASFGVLNSCTPEGFDVEPCSLKGKPAFRIAKIDGWFSDYQPRPNRVIVLAEGYGPGSSWPGVWAAELKYYGERNGSYETRPARKLIAYGQVLPGWQLGQRPKPLHPGTAYWFSAGDSGRSGAARFVAGTQFEPC